MAGSITRRHLNKNFELIGVAASSTSYLNLIHKTTEEEGMCYYDTTRNQLRTHDGSNWSPAGLQSISAGGLNNAASIGATITDYAIEINESDNSDLVCLTLDQDDATNNAVTFLIENAGSGASIDIDGTDGNDIEGSGDTWSINASGVTTVTELKLADGKNLSLGDDPDVTIDFNDGAIGTAGKGVIFTPAADEKIQFGAAAFSFDVWFVGDTATTNRVWFDLDGGADSVGALAFANCDLDLGDADLIRLGGSQDFTLGHQSSTVQHLCLLGSGGQFNIGVDDEGMDIYWYAEVSGEQVHFDESAGVVDFTGIELCIDDNSELNFGTGDDWAISGTSNLLMLPKVDNSVLTVGNSGGTIAADLLWYTATAGAGFFIDNSADLIYIDAADFRLGDNDYILLGDDATAGASADATIRWDTSQIEVNGDTYFKHAVTVDGNLTVSGTFNVTGSWDPASFGFSDDEYITWGAGPDYKMLHIASTINILQISASADNDIIRFGNGLVDPDIIYAENADTSGANFWWDGSGEELFFGKDDDGMDCTWYAETTTDYMKWDQDGATNVGQLIFKAANVLMMDDAKINFGDSSDWWIMSSGTNLIIDATTAGAAVQFGAVQEGCDVHFYGTTNDYDMLWDQGLDGLLIYDNTKLCIGATIGSPDLLISSDGTGTSIVLGVSSAITGEQKILTFGATGTHGLDVTFQLKTASSHVKVDAGASTVTFGHPVQLVFNASETLYTINTDSDVSDCLMFDATDTSVSKISFGINTATTNGLDVIFRDASGAAAIVWDAAATTFTMAAPTQLVLSASDINYTINQSIGTTQSGVLCITATDTSIAKVCFGTTAATTNGLDVSFMDGSGIEAVKWDAASTTFTIAADAAMVFSASDLNYTINHGVGATCSGALIIAASDTSIAKVQFGASGATTHGLDIVVTNASGESSLVWDAAATTFSIAEPAQLIFSGSDVSYTMNHNTTSSGYLSVFATDTSIARVQFGISSATTNGLDVTFRSASATGRVIWDAGTSLASWTDLGVEHKFQAGEGASTVYTVYSDSNAGHALRISATADTAINKIIFGSSGFTTNGMDVKFYLADDSSYVAIDGGASTFTIGHPVRMDFTASDVNYGIYTDSTAVNGALRVTGLTDTTCNAVVFGTSTHTTNGTDVTFLLATDSSFVKIDAGASTFTINHPVQQVFSGSDCSYTVNTDSDVNDCLMIDATDTSVAKISFGINTATTNGLDVSLRDASGMESIKWDAASTTFTVADPAQLVFSSSGLNYTINTGTDSNFLKIGATDSSSAKVQFGISTATTNGLDIVIYGKSTSGMITWDAATTTASWTETGVEHKIRAGEGASTVYSIFSDSNAGHALRITTTADTAINKLIFGTSTYTTNGLDIVFTFAQDSSFIEIDAGASTFTISHPVQQVFSASDTNYMINTNSAAGDALTITATDTSVSKLLFGSTTGNTNGLDVWFCATTGDNILKWDAGAGTLTTHTTGVSLVIQGSSGVWESGLAIPKYTNEPDSAATAGSIGWDQTAKKFCLYSGSAWFKTAALTT